MDKEVTIQYVNERAGNRPPSLKCDDGNYYTISDDAYPSMVPWKGQPGQISFTTNPKGFHNATHWNGMELPKGGQQRAPAPVGAPSPRLAPVAPPPARSGAVPFGYVEVEGGRVRTMPSVKEQFVMRVVEAAIHAIGKDALFNDRPLAELVAVIEFAKTAWEQTMEKAPPNAEQGQDLNNQSLSARDTDTREGMAPGPGYSDGAPPWEPPGSPNDYLGSG